jgi:hypothetical protein
VASGIFQFRNPYTTPKKKRRKKEKPAELLRIERRVIHGQEVDVQIWSTGPSPVSLRNPTEANKSGEEMSEGMKQLHAKYRGEYTPRKELAYIGVPASPHKDRTDGGGERESRVEDHFNPSASYE